MKNRFKKIISLILVFSMLFQNMLIFGNVLRTDIEETDFETEFLNEDSIDDEVEEINTYSVIDNFSITGNGTEANPYEINSIESLKNIENDMEAYYILTADIDLRGESFLPIGYGDSETKYSPFKGTFDGQNYTISNLNITLNSNVGLFGELNSATIKNLVLENFNTEAKSYAGSLAGSAYDSTIDNITAKNVNIYLTNFQSGGGLLGYANRTNIYDSHVDGNVLGKGDFIGGIVGYGRTSNLYKSSFVGDVSSTSNGQYGDGLCVGGLLGSGKDNNIEESFVKANVSCVNGYVGGIVGQTSGYLNLSNSFVVGNLSGKTSIAGFVSTSMPKQVTNIKIENSYFVGDIDSRIASNDGALVIKSIDSNTNIINSYFDKDILSGTSQKDEGRSTLELKNKSTYVGWSFNDVWEIDEGKDYPILKWFENNNDNDDNDTNESEISKVSDFEKIYKNPSGNFTIENDIDFNNQHIVGGNIFEDDNFVFSGELDGNGFEIKNLVIGNDHSDFLGLLGGADNAKVSNLKLNNITFKSGNSMLTGFGTLFHCAYDTEFYNITSTNTEFIFNDSNTYRLGGSYYWINYLGGLVGESTGNTYERCYYKGKSLPSLISKELYISDLGGLIGKSINDYLNNCGVEVDLYNNFIEGGFTCGLIGSSYDSSINNSYVKGDLTILNNGYMYIPTLAGITYGNGNKISNTYYAGNITAGNNKRVEKYGISNESINSYYDKNLLSDAIDTSNGASTTQMMKKSTFVGWDFNNDWRIDEGKSYPYLKSLKVSLLDKNISLKGTKYNEIINEVTDINQFNISSQLQNMKFMDGRIYLDVIVSDNNKEYEINTSGKIYKDSHGIYDKHDAYMIDLKGNDKFEILSCFVEMPAVEKLLLPIHRGLLLNKPILKLSLFNNENNVIYYYEDQVQYLDFLNYIVDNSIDSINLSEDIKTYIYYKSLWFNNFMNIGEINPIDGNELYTNNYDNIDSFSESSGGITAEKIVKSGSNVWDTMGVYLCQFTNPSDNINNKNHDSGAFYGYAIINHYYPPEDIEGIKIKEYLIWEYSVPNLELLEIKNDKSDMSISPEFTLEIKFHDLISDQTNWKPKGGNPGAAKDFKGAARPVLTLMNPRITLALDNEGEIFSAISTQVNASTSNEIKNPTPEIFYALAKAFGALSEPLEAVASYLLEPIVEPIIGYINESFVKSGTVEGYDNFSIVFGNTLANQVTKHDGAIKVVSSGLRDDDKRVIELTEPQDKISLLAKITNPHDIDIMKGWSRHLDKTESKISISFDYDILLRNGKYKNKYGSLIKSPIIFSTKGNSVVHNLEGEVEGNEKKGEIISSTKQYKIIAKNKKIYQAVNFHESLFKHTFAKSNEIK